MLTLEFLQKLQNYRHHIHQHPETAFEEVNTAKFVTEKLRECGLDVYQGLAKTGIVGVLKKGTSSRSIALRADLDALDMQEENKFSHASKITGKMHACGHDGHITMLLGAVEYLSLQGKFDGTVYFIFQPAEESDAGGKVMIEEGLFNKFPCDEVYALHNWPGLPLNTFAVMDGEMMASSDEFTITITSSKSGHAALPHLCQDSISIAVEMVTQLNQIISRKINALETAVLSVTKISGGTAYNVLPERVEIWGTVRTFSAHVQDIIENEMSLIAESLAKRSKVKIQMDYERNYCPTINHLEQANFARKAIYSVTKQEARVLDPSMASEDFGFMLKEKPGCFALLGNGDSAALHHSQYDFDDTSLKAGVEYWITLTEQRLLLK